MGTVVAVDVVVAAVVEALAAVLRVTVTAGPALRTILS